ncbi:amine oxidase catalytic domain-containing protein [Panus rudis PR-1116 ss-1]|nr:amine oxidase catalytic domain-containing protein [Panus rudis PR-1116 ss-1]
MPQGYEPLKQSDYEDEQRPRVSSRRLHRLLILLVATGALATLYVLPSRFRVTDDAFTEDIDQPLKQCASGLPPIAKPPADVNLWATLTVDETTAITNWLNEPSRNLNLTRSDNARLSDNVIYHIEAYRPAKADALRYLDSPSMDTLPPKTARVTIHHGSASDPYIMDYLVGPLPISSETKLRKLTEIYHREPIPFNARGYTGIVMSELNPLMAEIMRPLKDIVKELFGNTTLVAAANGPMSFDGSFRRTWVSWRRKVSGPWLHPVGFWQYVDVSGNDPSKWKVLKIVYNHQVFPSVEAFAEAFNNGTLKRLPPRPDQNEDSSWSTRRRPSFQRDLDHLPGPRSVSFGGLRYRVDRARQYISWMGWGMYLGFDRDMGLSLWDLRFRNERLIYELSPQEAIAQYAGNDPMQATTAWLDRYFGMGSAVRDMLPGYDCPYEAVYLPATTHTNLGSITRERAICVFEQDTGRPITRHTGYDEEEFGAVRGYVLTVRSISTVGKPTHIFDYIFHIDGTIEVRVSASGYLQGGYWEESQEPYGTAIRDTSMGSLHDHVINFKVDLDIAGLENSLLYTHTSQEELTQPWFDEDWGQTVIQQRINRDYIETEDEALLKFPTNFQGGYSFVNKEKHNSWKTPRGYAIHAGYSPIHNTVVGSKRLLNNANWARYNLAVSKRKETEPTSSSMWNLNLPGEPMVDFHKFFDGENITQEDLVAWINVGTHHLPQAEDSPNTRTNIATSSFFLTPLNYFDADVSMESTNAILLSTPKVPGEPFGYNDYGVAPTNCIPGDVPPFEYSGLKAFSVDGKAAPPASLKDLRNEAELYHRIDVEL